MATDTWAGGSASWTTLADWSAGVPTASSQVVVSLGDPQIAAAISIATLTDSAAVTFSDAGSSVISGLVDNYGSLDLDIAHGKGGSNLTVGGVLTNTGIFQVGDSDNSLAASDTIKVAGIVNSIGDIDLYGGVSTSTNLLLDVTAGQAGFGTPGALGGDVVVSDHAQIEFAGGEINRIVGGASLTLNGLSASIFDAGTTAANSALSGLTLVAGTLDLENGAAVTTTGALNNINTVELSTAAGSSAAVLTIGGAFDNYGDFSLDSGAGGGSVLVVKGALTNDDVMDLGSNDLTHSSTVTATSLVNNGELDLYSQLPTAFLMQLRITTGTAGFGVAGVLSGSVTVSGNSEIVFGSGQITTVASSSYLELDGATARISDVATQNSNSALTGLDNVAGTLELESGATLTTSGALTIGSLGAINIDDLYKFGGEGGSSLTVGGALTNNGTLSLGGNYITGDDQITTKTIVNQGALSVEGGTTAPEAALLNVTSGVAGFGTAGVVTGDVTVSGDASIMFAGGKITTIQGGSSLNLGGASAAVGDAGGTSALTGLTSVMGSLDLYDGAKFSTTAALNNTGAIDIDTTGVGGSSLTVGGILTNSEDLSLGSNALSRASTLQVTALHNTGTIDLAGGPTATAEALLRVTGSAAGFGTADVLSGNVDISGTASILFAAGKITTIQAGASLVLDDPGASLTIAGGASALAGLTSVAGTLEINNGAFVATSGALTNSGTTELDISNYTYTFDAGGSSLTVAGLLTNTGTLDLGNSSISSPVTVTALGLSNKGTLDLSGAASARALLNVTGGMAGFGTAGILTGAVALSGDSAIDFVAGTITTIQTGASLDLDGSTAVIMDSNATSALAGLTSVKGSLSLSDGASIATTATLTNSGEIGLDYYGELTSGGSGGSHLKVGGVLTNTGSLGVGGGAISQSDTVTATGVVNKGQITLIGGTSATTEALLDVTAGAAGFGAAGVVSGTVSLSGDSAIDFASGKLTSVQGGATLTLTGANAVIDTGAASALSGLTSVAGTLVFSDGANITTSGALTITGEVEVDNNYSSVGGSVLKVGGLLKNTGTLDIGDGPTGSLAKSVDVTATGLANTGDLTLAGGATATEGALLDVTAGVAGFGTAKELTGDDSLSGNAAIEFASGQITSIQGGGSLTLNGAAAFIEDGASNSNSALAGLATLDGALSLENGAKITTSGAVTSNSNLDVDSYYGGGGSSLAVGGLLTNDDFLYLGNTELTSSATVTANSLTNNDYVDLSGSAAAKTELAVSGSIINNYQFDLYSDTEVLAGAVSGTNGEFNLESGSSLEFDGSVGSGETIDFSTGANQLILGHAETFAANLISGFGAGDSIDVKGFGTGTTEGFSGGVLTLTDGANVAHLNFGVSATSAEFGVAVGATSTTITFV